MEGKTVNFGLVGGLQSKIRYVFRWWYGEGCWKLFCLFEFETKLGIVTRFKLSKKCNLKK